MDYVAELAHLALTPEERAHIGTQLQSILTYVDQLAEVDTTGVEAMSQVSTSQMLREDAMQASLDVEAATGNAAERGAGYFKVPKVIER